MEQLLKILSTKSPPRDAPRIWSTGMGPHADPEKYEQYLMSPWFNDEERKKLLRQRGVIR